MAARRAAPPRRTARWPRRGIPLISLLAFSAGCAAGVFTPPSGPSVPAPDAGAAWTEATAGCRDIHSYRVSGRMSAHVGGRRIPTVGLDLAIDAAGRIGLEAHVSGTLLFKLGGETERAALYVADGAHVVSARADEIVGALVGAKLGPPRLLAVLSGCASRAQTFARAARRGEFLEVTTNDAVVYLWRRDGRWTPRAAAFDDLVIGYPEFAGGYPRTVTIASAPGRTPVASITLHLDQTAIDTPIDPASFVVNTANATPMSLEELRATGPLGSGR